MMTVLSAVTVFGYAFLCDGPHMSRDVTRCKVGGVDELDCLVVHGFMEGVW